MYWIPEINYFNKDNFTGQQDETIENDQESAKAIVVADCFNKINYQYLLDEKRWIRLNKFPQTVVNTEFLKLIMFSMLLVVQEFQH